MCRSMSPVILIVGIVSVYARADIAGHFAIDVSGLAGKSIELEVSVYNNNGIAGDSRVQIDNVALGSNRQEFETGSLGGFDATLNPASVNVVSGSLNGTGSYVLQVDEDPAYSPTITFCDFAGSSATTLDFDISFSGSSSPGFFGLDDLVVRLLDPQSLEPLLQGLNPGVGDLLAVDEGSVQTAGGVSFSPAQTVPAPGAIVLGSLGLALTALGARRRQHG